LQEITDAEALAEGVPSDYDYVGAGNETYCPTCGGFGTHGAFGENYGVTEVDCEDCASPKLRFRNLWNRLYGPEAWSANPELVALTFSVHRMNIDAFKAQRRAA
jgi:hypothetical protein